MVNRVEAIVDALGKVNGMANPTSEAYVLRNPLLIRYEYARKVAPRVQTLITDGNDLR